MIVIKLQLTQITYQPLSEELLRKENDFDLSYITTVFKSD